MGRRLWECVYRMIFVALSLAHREQEGSFTQYMFVRLVIQWLKTVVVLEHST